MDQIAASRRRRGIKDSYPVRWAGRQAVVVLPEHIGHANAPQVGEQLRAPAKSVFYRGVSFRDSIADRICTGRMVFPWADAG